MRKILLALGIMALICTPAMAGVNANGAIIVHTNDAYTYSAGTRCTTPLARPATCQETITETDRDATRSVLWFLWAFLPTATPRVTTVYFGMNMDMTCLDPTEFTWAWCSPTGVTPSQDVSAGWPGDGESATVGWPVAITENLYPFMVIRAGVELCGAPGAYICSSINHVGGYAAFVDDSNPPVTDLVDRFGCVRWYEPGYANCPEPIVERGACCYPDGSCQYVEPTACVPPGVFLGVGTTCQPVNPCPMPGACCDTETGDCTYVLRTACLPPSQFLGEGILCLPNNPCPQPGACCDPATGQCFFIMEAMCTPPRVWYGGPCGPNNEPCPQPPEPGACCFLDGTCRVIIEDECTRLGGFLFVPGEDCVDDCPPVPTEKTTWGKIKANYK